MFNTLKGSISQPVTQRQPLSGMTVNNAGGYGYEVDGWQLLRRFLILGTTGGTYYVGEKELTRENLDNIRALVIEDPARALAMAKEVSEQGLAPSNDPALYVLACVLSGPTAHIAYGSIPDIARTFTHLSHLMTFIKKGKMRGFGRGLRRAIAKWYTDKSADDLVYQAIKYKSRDGFSQADVMRIAHVGSFMSVAKRIEVQDVFRYLGYFKKDAAWHKVANEKLDAVYKLFDLKPENEAQVVELVKKYRLPMEAVPTELRSAAVYEAAAVKPNLGWLVRNLGNFGKTGLLTQSPCDFYKHIASVLSNEEHIQKARLHPLSIYIALKQYATGQGFKGSGKWPVNAQLLEVLTDAFHKAFKYVQPTGKKFLIACDVSGSMSGKATIGGMPVPLHELSGLMALSVLQAEDNCHVIAFDTAHGGGRTWGGTVVPGTSGIYPLPISKNQRLDDVTRMLSQFGGGGTDCQLPFEHALKNNIFVDCFVCFTDGETWAGKRHVVEALKEYRAKVNPKAKAINIAMAATKITALDNNPLNLEIAGFDASIPQLISGFVKD